MRYGTALLVVLLCTLPAHAGGVSCMRRSGPPALSALMTRHADAIARHRAGEAVEDWARIAAELDAVAAQRDAWASGLYWHTDLEAAKAAAKRENRPLLSLRLLGRFDEELSCANSRFFRTTLYPAAEVNRRLRERFVLHWSSERPVPVITVDFGDGRTMRRTVTGNSAHYMMTSDGAVVDVLPGLYGARPFAAWLDEAGDLATRIAGMTPAIALRQSRRTTFRKYSDVTARWATDQRLVNAQPADARAAKGAGKAVPAVLAGERAISKTGGEGPLVRLVSADNPQDANAILWSAIANLHRDDSALDPAAVALIRAKRPAGNVDALLSSLQSTIAQDSVRNEYTLHRQVHAWFARPVPPTDFASLNRRVYAELFLTPRSDPWLGLAPPHAWSGLEDDGLVQTASAGAN